MTLLDQAAGTTDDTGATGQSSTTPDLDAGGEPAAGAGTGDGTGDGTGGEGSGGSELFAGLSDDLKPIAEGYDSVESVFKDLSALQEKAAVPESADGYGLKIPEGVDLQKELGIDAEEYLKAAAEEALACGIPKSVAQVQVDRAVKAAVARTQQYQKEVASRSKAETEKALQDLRTSWGKDFSANMAKAGKVLNAVLSEASVEKLNAAGLGDDPQLVKDLFSFSSKLSEETFLSRSGAGAGAPPMERDSTGTPFVIDVPDD